MKNEKINKVLDVVIKVISIVSILAQAIKSAFPVSSVKTPDDLGVSEENYEEIKKFLQEK